MCTKLCTSSRVFETGVLCGLILRISLNRTLLYCWTWSEAHKVCQGLSRFCTHFLTCAIPANVASVLPDSSPAEQQFIQSLTSHRRKIKSVIMPSTAVTLLGQPMYRNLKRPDYVALHCMSPVVTQTVVAYYDRAVIHGEIVYSLSYCKSLTRNSYTVWLVDGRYFQISTFIVTDLGFGQQCYAIGRYLCRTPFQFCVCKKMASLKLSHICWLTLMNIISLCSLGIFLTHYSVFTYWSFKYLLQTNWKK